MTQAYKFASSVSKCAFVQSARRRAADLRIEAGKLLAKAGAIEDEAYLWECGLVEAAAPAMPTVSDALMMAAAFQSGALAKEQGRPKSENAHQHLPCREAWDSGWEVAEPPLTSANDAPAAAA